jgi:hypothetical protein
VDIFYTCIQMLYYSPKPQQVTEDTMYALYTCAVFFESDELELQCGNECGKIWNLFPYEKKVNTAWEYLYKFQSKRSHGLMLNIIKFLASIRSRNSFPGFEKYGSKLPGYVWVLLSKVIFQYYPIQIGDVYLCKTCETHTHFKTSRSCKSRNSKIDVNI